MRVSVIINTLNRVEALRHTLASLRQQTYRDFEVLVVNGPSTDGTDRFLQEQSDAVRSLSCPHPRLAISRNVGIRAAAGEVLAFLDDDALATPTWIEELATAYDAPNVGAVGGLVLDQTGVELQFRYAACHRNGLPLFNVEPPLERFAVPNADPVAYLQGTNMSYRRDTLRQVGGFDERILHFFDDVDLCLRVIDHGYVLKQLDGAVVHHKFLASHVRDANKETTDPFNQLSDRIYFGMKHGRARYSISDLMAGFFREVDYLHADSSWRFEQGRLTQDQLTYFRQRVDEAIYDGIARANGTPYRPEVLPPPPKESFRPFPVVVPKRRRLRLCFISSEYPPGEFGGPGRYTHELATGLADAGHEVHVITASPDIRRVDLEDGVWVHRQPPPERMIPELDGVTSTPYILAAVDAYHEVCRLGDEAPLDMVMSPLWLFEGLVCACDPEVNSSVTVITAMKAVGSLAEWGRSADALQLVAFEQEYLRRARHLHVISAAIRERAVTDYDIDTTKTYLAPLGIRDRRDEYPRRRLPDGRLRVLYVARLEERKGADVFLEAAVRLGREFPNTEFVLVGKEIPTDGGQTHRERFAAEFADEEELASRVVFTGPVGDDELFQHYADCDIFCLPTHYESFGLVFIEAMAWGKPLVGSQVGGVPEVVVDGEQGMLCPVGDVEAVVNALRVLITDDELRQRFGQRSRELFEERWQIQVAVARLAGLISERSHPRESSSRNGRGEVTEAFATTLHQATGLAPELSRAAATRLLNRAHHPIDRALALSRSLEGPPEGIAEQAFRLLLGRSPTPEEHAEWRARLEGRTGPAELIEFVRSSREFAERSIPFGELVPPNLQTLLRTPLPNSSTTEVPRPHRTRKERIASIPVLGKLLRYGKAVVYLPWNFHRFFYFIYPAHQKQLEAVLADQDGVVERLARLESLVGELLTGQNQTDVMVRTKVAGLVNALEDITSDVAQALDEAPPS